MSGRKMASTAAGTSHTASKASKATVHTCVGGRAKMRGTLHITCSQVACNARSNNLAAPSFPTC